MAQNLLNPLITPAFIAHLTEVTKHFPLPLVDTMIIEFGHNPFIILISCLLSLRARDVVTVHVCRELFARVTTPEELIAMSTTELEKIIYRTGFYKNKARILKAVSKALIEKHAGTVPHDEAALRALPGVGHKTAALVRGVGFNIPAVCVDTHVHRISNIWGIVSTATPEKTEAALKKALPEEYWIIWNRLLVMIGQNMRTPDIILLQSQHTKFL